MLFRRLSAREMRRLMQRMGVSIEELPNAVKVEIHLSDGKKLVIENPHVSILSMEGQSIYQVVGNAREESVEEGAEELEIPEEDVQLVAEQAGVTLEEARKALKFTKGDLAQAILLLKQKGRS